jgi:glucosamine--fructose-6-phosphate aminotransferase (isomerizing)
MHIRTPRTMAWPIVHNGIIENHEELRDDLKKLGYTFTSETDTEVIAHRVHHHMQAQKDLFKAVRATAAELEGRLRARGRQ